MRTALDELGRPVFGLTGPLAREGVMNGHGGKPCNQVTMLYRSGEARTEVTTSRHPLGGTDRLVHDVLFRSIPDPVRLPLTITVTERLVMIPVSDVQTQFRVLEATDGTWVAAGGFEKPSRADGDWHADRRAGARRGRTQLLIAKAQVARSSGRG
jgi:hypothetical protein